MYSTPLAPELKKLDLGQGDILVLFPPKRLRMTQNGHFCPICNFSNIFPPKWLGMTWNGQFCLISNFSTLFPPKWLRKTRNGQFHLICNFSNLFLTEVAQNDSEWPISPDLQLFQSFPTKVAQNY